MSIARTAELADVEAEFGQRTRRIVWCTLATVAPDGRPWTRIVHPIWEGATGWVATGRHGLKAAHLAHEPRVSLTYWNAVHDVVTVQADATWADDPPTRARVWELFRSAEPPLGYDPAAFWPDPAAAGVLRLDATRIDLLGLAAANGPRLSWRRPT